MKLLCTMILLLAANAAFAQGAGRFLSVVGDVRITAADGKTRTAERGGDLREGDTIVTGANALAQLRMADGAQMSVRPDTEMRLERFSYGGEEDRQSSFLASIVKGGLRVITGLMARQNRAGYSIRTASATLGVRGTHFELVHVPQARIRRRHQHPEQRRRHAARQPRPDGLRVAARHRAADRSAAAGNLRAAHPHSGRRDAAAAG